jgi:hypothetical protein
MGLKEAFQKAAAVAFNAAGNVKISVIYSSNPNPDYNPSTGVVDEEETHHPNINAIREDYAFDDIDDVNVKPEDIKLMILYADLSISLHKDQDYVTINGVRWGVINWQIDPADAVWTIQIRQ